jgi:hypothetical protein
MEIPEKVFHQILALGEAWRVTTVDYLEKERAVIIRVEETPQGWATQACLQVRRGFGERLRSRARAPVASPQCLPVGVEDCLCAAARTMSGLREGFHDARPVGGTESSRDAGV